MKNGIVNKMSGVLRKASFKVQKHSPEILVAVGVAGAVTSAVMACKATLKVNEILDETKEDMNTVRESKEKGCTPMGADYTEDDAKKDTVIVYAQTSMKLAKLYGPAISIGAFSIASILVSNHILKKRNVAITAAYAALNTNFKEYRQRVVEQFGKDTDWALKHNIKAERVTETVTDEETGKEKKVKKTAFVVNPSDVSGYARFFEKYTVDENGNSVPNPYWESNNEYNLMFIKSRESYANDLLKAKGRLFLNDVYEMLGLPSTKAGQIVGWVYDPEHPVGDNYVDFGLYSDNLSYSDFANGFDPAILLDFNVDGNIWDLM